MRDMMKVYLQPAFLICAVVLVIAGSGMSIAIRSLGVHLKKDTLPLKKTLDLLDQKGLSPYEVVSKRKIEKQEVVKGLGTEDYIEWELEDTQASSESAARRCLLFVTYYELPDSVPHVPEECYMGSGYQRLASDSVMLETDEVGGEGKIPARYLVFASTKFDRWGKITRFPVLYLFNVNGVYANSRDGARFALYKNLRSKYSYFSKVEWKFFNTRFGSKTYPSKKEAIAASQKLLSVVLPILEKEHWPDWPVVDGE